MSFLGSKDRRAAAAAAVSEEPKGRRWGARTSPGRPPAEPTLHAALETSPASPLPGRRATTSLPSTRTASALLQPVPLINAPPPIAPPAKKRRRPVRRIQEERRKTSTMKWRTGVAPLDIEDGEIDSLADYLMGHAGEGAKRRRSSGSSFSMARDGTLALVGRRESQSSTDGFQKRREQVRRLPAVIIALRSAAEKLAPGMRDASKHVRGPGPASVPGSAARVLRAMASLERLWCPGSASSGGEGPGGGKQGQNGFSGEELEELVYFFDASGTGYMRLDDVARAFGVVRGDRSSRRPPSAHILPCLVSIGRRLHETGITVAELVRGAAALSMDGVVSPGRGVREGWTGLVSPDRWPGEELDGADGTAATREQMRAMLCRVMPDLTEEQCNAVVEHVEEDGVVSVGRLEDAVERAMSEVDYRPYEDRGRFGDDGDSEDESDGSGDARAGCHGRRRSSAEGSSCGSGGAALGFRFNRVDAAILLYKFTRDAGGLRSITPRSVAASWNALKRRNQGLQAYRAGRSATRCLGRLLRERSLKPLAWFNSLEVKAAHYGSEPRQVPVSSVVAGMRALLATADPALVRFDSDSGVDDPGGLRVPKSGSGSPRPGIGFARYESDQKWTPDRLAALTCHLDPCGEGTITSESFHDALCDSGGAEIPYWDSSSLASARHLEAALRDIGYNDVRELLQTLVAERGADGLDEYMRKLAGSTQPINFEGDVPARVPDASRARRASEKVMLFRKIMIIIIVSSFFLSGGSSRRL